MTGKGRWQPHPVIARSPCDDRVRRTSKSEGGSNPVLSSRLLDCFAALAMTGRGRRKPFPVIARSACDEAIQLFLSCPWIASLALAMTGRGRRKPWLRHGEQPLRCDPGTRLYPSGFRSGLASFFLMGYSRNYYCSGCGMLH